MSLTPRFIKRYLKSFRRWRYTRAARKTVAAFEEPIRVNNPSRLTKNTYLGKNTHFNGMTILGNGKVTIGDNFHSGNGCKIRTEGHNHEGDALPYDLTYVVGDVTIGENVWLGEGVLILPGVTIGEGAIIQTRSVVVSDIPPLSIAGGHPCRVFSSRDAEKYHRLKAEKRFV